MFAASLGIGSKPMGNLATTRLLFPKVSFPNYFIRLEIFFLLHEISALSNAVQSFEMCTSVAGKHITLIGITMCT